MTLPKANLPLRLGVNIDHVATLRNARGGAHPDPVRAAHIAISAGADGITAHLREDRRHIRDDDIARLKAEITRPLNFEMAATDEMVAIALKTVPNACCLVPERREERTTEGGLDVVSGGDQLQRVIGPLREAGIRVSLFIAPDARAVEASAALGADIVELHTGPYCEAALENNAGAIQSTLKALRESAGLAHAAGLEVHAGHGLTFNTVGAVAAMPEMVELNIGQFLVGEAVFIGLGEAVSQMREMMASARQLALTDQLAADT
ncbi:MAG: pyridoxine 5'-phosphate synthase [Pseudomonadota bacterium]